MKNSPVLRPLSLIVAEDDELRRAQLRRTLQHLGARVREASDGWELMSLLLATGDQVDLVISDLHVLGAGGLDALVAARAAGIEVPFLFLTSGGSPATQAAAARLGASVLDDRVASCDLLARVQQMCCLAGEQTGQGRGTA